MIRLTPIWLAIGVSAASLLTAACAQADEEAAVKSAGESTSWSYQGPSGPDHWGELSADYHTCAAGRMQSPIDLSAANVTADVPLFVDYAPAPLAARNTGKTVQVDFPAGSHLSSSGRVFELVQVHFHSPSEHSLDGVTYPLVAHFVHASDEGELAVLGVFFDAGEANGELQKIIDGLEASSGEAPQFSAGGLVPGDLEAYRYMGSLTTPPCSEGVHWHVVKEPIPASQQQIDAMASVMAMNARPVQPAHGRLVVAPD